MVVGDQETAIGSVDDAVGRVYERRADGSDMLQFALSNDKGEFLYRRICAHFRSVERLARGRNGGTCVSGYEADGLFTRLPRTIEADEVDLAITVGAGIG